MTPTQAEKQILVHLAALITTLDDVGSGVEGTIYMAFRNEINMDAYFMIVGMCIKAGWITKGNFILTITDKGREMAKKLKAAIPGA